MPQKMLRETAHIRVFQDQWQAGADNRKERGVEGGLRW